MRSLHIAATGMLAQQTNVEVISNNLANMNTTGYKRRRAEFQDLIYQNVRRVGSQSSDTGTSLPQGAQVDQTILRPGVLANMLDQTCGKRPTVVVMSACLSGVFVPALAQSNRMVLTAARPDRTSFGCGQDNKYPYFDECFLSSMPRAANFGALAVAARECVRVRETAEKLTPPSEPQIWVGPQLRPMLPLYAFEGRRATD